MLRILASLLLAASLAVGFRVYFPRICRSSFAVLAQSDDADTSGYFRLPSDNEIFPLNYFLEAPVDDDNNKGGAKATLDEQTVAMIERQLESSFDNYQPWETKDIAAKLLLLPEQLERVRVLALKLDGIERIGDARGWDEGLVDMLRTTRSEVRMYAKDAELYQFSPGSRSQLERKKEPSFWSWGWGKK